MHVMADPGKMMVFGLFFPALAEVLLLMISSVGIVNAHPQCLDFFAPFAHGQEPQPEFCALYQEFGCCTLGMDRGIQDRFEVIAEEYGKNPSALYECLGFLKDILCQECSPYAAHLFDAEATQKRTRQLPGLCRGYCAEFHQSCSQLVPMITTEEPILWASGNSTDDFCQMLDLVDADYCFPDVLKSEDLSQWVEEAKTGTGRSECLCLEEFANSLKNPLLAIHANDGTHRFFIGEQIGVIHVFLINKTRLEEPFLDIRESVLTSGRRGDERGLLGGAFHPDFVHNSKFYVFYSSGSSDDQLIRISEFTLMTDDMNRVNASTEKVILEIDQPYANHNGGLLMFGDDGYLYASIGDGGAAGDPLDSGLDKNTLLGKIIRIDVDNPSDGQNYGIPPDNPFVGYDNQTARYENYAYGVRNMWRCSKDRGDRETGYGKGRIFCGDVGQSKFEEIDIIVRGGNYGWRGREGYECYKNAQCNDEWLADEILPIHVYPHSVGKSVTGGYVYRGCLSPNLNGRYIFGDFVNGRLFQLNENNATQTWDSQEICMGDSSVCLGNLVDTYPKNILSFGEDEAGEVYILVTDFASTTHDGGKVYKLVDPGRRGNPTECFGELTDVDIQGPTIPFVPSDHAQKSRRKPRPSVCTTGEDQGLVNNRTVCNSDFVLSGMVLSVKQYRRERRVLLKVFSIERQAPSIPKITKEVLLTVTCKKRRCDCPNLRPGRVYFLSGQYQKSWDRLVLDTGSFWRDWNWLLAFNVKVVSLKCQDVSIPSI